MKKTMIVGMMILLAEPAFATCDFKHFPFGQGIVSVASAFNNTEEPVEAISSGTNQLLVRARNVCAELPDRSVVTINFVDDRMYEITIKNSDSDGSILAQSESNFGPAIRKTNPSHPKAGNFQSVWVDGDISVIYYSSTADVRPKESVSIATDKYKSAYNAAIKSLRSKDEADIPASVNATVQILNKE